MSFEDFEEKLELLPHEIQNRFMKMKEIDLCVKNSMNSIEKNINTLFSKAKHMDPDKLETNFNALMVQGKNPITQSDEKIQLANSMQGMLTKYMNELDQELNVFKTKLETQTNGVTKVIEKIVLDSEKTLNFKQNKKKKKRNNCLFEDMDSSLNSNNKFKQKTTINDPSSLQFSKNAVEILSSSAVTKVTPSNTSDQSGKDSLIVYDVPQVDVSTKQLFQKASLEADNPDILSTNQMNATSCVLPLKPSASVDKTKTIDNQNPSIVQIPMEENDNVKPTDSNEKLYCICNQVAYGTMIGCDNRNCLHEWFHYDCVGIKTQPKGKWYCYHCAKRMKKKRPRMPK